MSDATGVMSWPAHVVGLVIVVLLLAGCQLYWTKPGSNLAAFTADHQACMEKGAKDVGSGQVIVDLDVYRACLKVSGWKRETGGKVGNPAGFYRGLEDEGPMLLGFVPKQVGETEGASRVNPHREMFCRRAHLEGRTDWRQQLDAFNRCLTE